MQPAMTKQIQEQIIYPTLPLAIYRELAAHLQQIEGITVQLLPQNSPQFDYAQSQIGGIILEYPQALDLKTKEKLEAILTYYSDRYQAFQRQTLDSYN